MPSRRVPVQVLPRCRGRIAVPEMRRIARYVLSAEAVDPRVQAEVVLADPDTVQTLNRLYRGRDEPTDVLSFAEMDTWTWSDDDPPVIARSDSDEATPVVPVPFIDAPEDDQPTLGEVIICVAIVEAQAQAAGLPVAGQIAHHLVHGLLHLIGHDHEASDEDSERMQAREDQLLAGLGYANAYAHGH